jgi:hypothetical protein
VASRCDIDAHGTLAQYQFGDVDTLTGVLVSVSAISTRGPEAVVATIVVLFIVGGAGRTPRHRIVR